MKTLETATDMEVAIDMANHINHPCFFQKDSKEYSALRQSYIAMANEIIIPTLTNPYAKTFLEKAINQYNS